MKTCKDCIHYEVCAFSREEIEGRCKSHFADKSLIGEAYKKGYEEGVGHTISLLVLVEKEIINGEPKVEPVGICDIFEQNS